MEQDLFRSKLHKHKKRITPQREAVYKALMDSKNHPNAEEIHKKVSLKFPNVSLATVYQILNLFENDLNLIKSINVDNTKHYEIDSKFHIHLVCPQCGEISDIYSDKIKFFWKNLIKELDLNPKDQTIKIYQICKNCTNSS
ncbi:MAG: transcriptional repressor [Promethearchaeota archaeon]|nr:MAG: transcriptional repressor [Candidatus Lokiarchaeota archaeon]